MESDVFNRLIGAWHAAGAGTEPSQVNPPPSGMGPRAAGIRSGKPLALTVPEADGAGPAAAAAPSSPTSARLCLPRKPIPR